MKHSFLKLLALFIIAFALLVNFSCGGDDDNPVDDGNNNDNLPVVTITSPTGGASFTVGGTITFTGSATDEEDGALTGSALVWTSDKDGQIGSGATFTSSSLSANSHVITLTATDSDNGIGTAVVTISVNQSSSITWEKTFGGTEGDWGYSVCETSDGGYVITGHTYSYGASEYDVYLIKIDISGTLVWEKTFGGTENDYGQSVCETSDGGYIITGMTYSYGAGGSDVYLIKADNNGNLVWEKTFGGASSDYGHSVCETSDSGYLITGRTNSYGAGNDDVYLVKTDINGNLVWQKTFGGGSNDIGESVRETSDGGYIITGYTTSFGAAGYWDVYLVKTDSNGDSLWTKTFGGISDDKGYSVCEASDGGYIITGITYSYGAGNADVYLIKTNNNGTLVWEKTFGGTANDRSYFVCNTSDGGFTITGNTKSYGAGLEDVYLVKTNSSGTLVWEKTFGGTGYDYGRSVYETSDGGYIITGWTNSFGAGSSDVYLIKTDANGNVN